MLVDRFELTEKDQSLYKGDTNSYFPLTFSSNAVYSAPLNVPDEDVGKGIGTNIYVSKNELTIEDSMFFYDKRSTTFLNYDRSEVSGYSTKAIRVGKDLKPFPENLYHFSF